MIEYQYNDGGRAVAGFKGDTGDCVVRAIAIVAGKPYQDVYKAMSSNMKKHGYVASGNAYAQKPKSGRAAKNKVNRAGDVQRRVLEGFGFVKVKLPVGPRPTYSEAFQRYGNCIVSTTKHMAALVDGALRDTFDGRSYQMLTPYCLPCSKEDFFGVDADGSGGGYNCNRCGETSNPVVFFNETHERKAQSVWVIPS